MTKQLVNGICELRDAYKDNASPVVFDFDGLTYDLAKVHGVSKEATATGAGYVCEYVHICVYT